MRTEWKCGFGGRSSVWSAPTCWRFCSRHGRIRSELACARGRQRRQVAALQTLARLRNSRVGADARSVRRAKQVPMGEGRGEGEHASPSEVVFARVIRGKAMSMRLEMLQVARLAPKLLGESTELVHDFLLRQQNEDGGFQDRSGKSDLYYTVFGLDGLLALQAEIPRARIAAYLKSFGDGEGLDFVHLCCLARAWAAISNQARPESGPPATEMVRRIEAFRARDGGYHSARGCEFGTAYAAFLAVGAYQDLKAEWHDSMRLVQSL